MKNYFFIILLFQLLLIPLSDSAQSVNDSLQKRLKTTTNDTDKVNIYNKLSIEQLTIYPEKALDFANEANKLARNINYKKGIVESFINMAQIYQSRKNIIQAEKYFDKATEASAVFSENTYTTYISLQKTSIYIEKKEFQKANENIQFIKEESLKTESEKKLYYKSKGFLELKFGNIDLAKNYIHKLIVLAENNNEKEDLAESYIQLGVVHQQLMEYKEAQNDYYKALKIYESTKDFKGQAITYLHLGDINKEQGFFQNAIKFFFKALSLYNEIGDQVSKSKCLDHIASVYQKQKNLDKAIDYYSQSLEIRKNIDNKELIATSFNALGSAYEQQKDIAKAIIYYFKSIKMREEMGSLEGMAESYTYLSQLYFNYGQLDKSFETATKAYEISKKINDIWWLKESAKILAEINKQKGNYKEGYLFFETYSQLRDSLSNAQKSNQISRLEAIYESEKKEKAIALLNKENEIQDIVIKQQKTQRIVLYLVISLLIIVILFVYFGYRNKNKVNEQLEIQKELLAQKNKDITMSLHYAKRIQDNFFTRKTKLMELVKEAFVLFQPKDIISGDFYWFAKMKGKTIVAVVDCTGHGVPGAFMSMLGNELLNDIVKSKRIVDPGEILNRMHNRIVSGLNKNENESFTVDGMNIAICVVQEDKEIIEFCGSGRPMIVVSKGHATTYNGEKFPLGMVTKKERKFKTQQIKVEENDKFYIFTDGYTDQFDEMNQEKITRQGLTDLLVSIENNPLKEQEAILMDYFNNWKGSRAQLDDICVIGFMVK
jgi:serine phosphatase RsbU (regulator of sigma subunit)/TPR repeat protein